MQTIASEEKANLGNEEFIFMKYISFCLLHLFVICYDSTKIAPVELFPFC